MNTSEETVYERLGEFHDLFMEQRWAQLGPPLEATFGHLAADSVVAELGAGTGLGIRELARVTPARFWALEPSLVMRTTLTARVAGDEDLRSRVTIVAGSAPDALDQIPERVDGVVCANMLGHLDIDQRRAVFEWMDATLTDDGVCLVTTQERADQQTAGDLSLREVTERRRIGEYEYRAIYLESTANDSFSSRYEVWHGKEIVRSETYSGRWQVLTANDLAVELHGTGLVVSSSEPALAYIRRDPVSRNER